MFAHPSEHGAELRQVLSCAGDLFLAMRLEQWARHRRGAYIEQFIGPDVDNPMKSFAYRRTERGRHLWEHGLNELSEAPPLPIGGTEAYQPSAPWVVFEDGRLGQL